MNSKVNKILPILLIFSHVFIIIVFLSIFKINDIYYNNLLNETISFEDIVFSTEESSYTYKYYDYSIIKPKSSESLLSSDIYVRTDDINQINLFSYNWKLEKITMFEDESVYISINLARKHNINIGDFISVGNLEYKVSEFLPNYKGFNPKKNREGIILINDYKFQNNEDHEYIYFNYEKEALFSNSYYLRSIDYLSIENTILIVTLFIIINLIILYVYYVYSSSLKIKLKVLSFEKRKYSYLVKTVIIERLLLHGVILILALLILYVIFYSPLYNLLLINLFLMIIFINLIISLLLSFVLPYLITKKNVMR